MHHGQRLRVHPGTTTCLLVVPGSPYHNDTCTVLRFVAEKKKWQVRLEKPGADGKRKELLVPEDALHLSYTLLPTSPAKLKRPVALTEEDAQGTCGRGLILDEEHVDKGTVLFEEPPLFVTPTGVRRMHEDRWRAYLTLKMRAHRSPPGPAATALHEALDAFDALGIADKFKQSVTDAANGIIEDLLRLRGNAAEPISDEEKAMQLQSVSDCLMRFQSNQFKFENGAEQGCPRFSASAVFSFTSRLNHCCDPSAYVDTRKAAFDSGKTHAEDGHIIVRAYKPLRRGDRLTLNYGPRALIEWPLERRRGAWAGLGPFGACSVPCPAARAMRQLRVIAGCVCVPARSQHTCSTSTGSSAGVSDVWKRSCRLRRMPSSTSCVKRSTALPWWRRRAAQAQGQI